MLFDRNTPQSRFAYGHSHCARIRRAGPWSQNPTYRSLSTIAPTTWTRGMSLWNSCLQIRVCRPFRRLTKTPTFCFSSKCTTPSTKKFTIVVIITYQQMLKSVSIVSRFIWHFFSQLLEDILPFTLFFTEDLIPILNERAGFPSDTELALYEEIKPNMVERIDNLIDPLEKVLEELLDGDIIVFQKDERDLDIYELPTCRDYFKYVANRVDRCWMKKKRKGVAKGCFWGQVFGSFSRHIYINNKLGDNHRKGSF